MDKSQNAYSPVIVKNPVSQCHVVKLLPGQDFVLFLDPQKYPNYTVEVNSEYLDYDYSVALQANSEEYEVYNFFFPFEINKWAKYSACYLGEVNIDCQTGKYRLLIVLESINPAKIEHLTVINPVWYNIKPKLYNVLEFVIYSEELGYRAWDWTWSPVLPNSDLKLLRFSNSFSEIYDNADLKFARCSRVLNSSSPYHSGIKQSYFWFYFDEDLLKCIEPNETGLKHVGDLMFYAERFNSDSYFPKITFDCKIWIDFKKRDIKRLLTRSSVDLVPMAPMPPHFSSPQRLFDYRSDPADYLPANTPIKRQSLLMRDVSITQINFEDLDEDCLVITDKNDINVNHYNYDFDYLIGDNQTIGKQKPFASPFMNFHRHKTRWD